MKLNRLLEKLFEIEQKTQSIVNISIFDELNNDNGIISLTKEGGAFKVYIESDPNGGKDFIIVFDEENLEEKKKIYANYKVICISEVLPQSIKILYIQDLLKMNRILEINEYLEE